MSNPCLYILASKKNGTLYIGATDNLEIRIEQHKNKINEGGFTSRYNVNILVYCEKLISMDEALLKEKRMKKWPRKWKIDLIEKNNPEWKDLSLDFKWKTDNIAILDKLFENTRKK